MADMLNLSFGCGNTLLARQLNEIVEAINQLATLVDDQVGSYIPLSGSEKITGVLAPKTHEGYDLGKSDKRWGTVWASTGGFKTIDFYDLQTSNKLGTLEINVNNDKLQYNDEVLATRNWVNSLLNFTRINIGSTGSISEELYNDESNYIKIESSSDNPIVIAGYDENSLPIGIKFGDASTGDVLTVYNEKIYINGDIFGGENGVTELNDLSDVDASAARTGLFLMYNGTGWVNSPLPESLIVHPGDVSLNEEYYLMYEKTNEHPSGLYNWVERPSGATELNELNDVEINDTYLGLGQVLVYSQVTDEENNTYNSWVNKTLSGSLTYDQSDSDKYLKVKNDGTGTEWSGISLSDLSNTEIGGSNNALSNGLVLVYDLSLNKWKNTSLLANLPPTTDRSAGDYLVLKDDNGTLKAGWTSVTPGSGLTGIKYQTTGNATEITPSSGYVTLKAGNNVSFTTSTGGILEISASAGNLPPEGINGDHLIMGSDGPEWETSYNIYLVENGNKTLNGTITPQSTSNGGGIFIGTNKSGNIYSSLANPILLSPGTGGVQIANLGTGNSYALSTIKTSNDGNLILKSSVDTIIDTEQGSQYIYLNGSRIYLSTDTSTNGHYLSLNSSNLLCYDGNVIGSGGGLTSNSWAEYFNGKTKGTPTSGLYLKWDSNGNLTQDSGSYTLLPADDNTLGGIKTGYTNNNKNYKVLVDNNGNAYVNVPWTSSAGGWTPQGGTNENPLVSSSDINNTVMDSQSITYNLCEQLLNIFDKNVYCWYNDSLKQHDFFIETEMPKDVRPKSGYFYIKGSLLVSNITVSNIIFHYSGGQNGSLYIPVNSTSTGVYYLFNGNLGISSVSINATYLSDICSEISLILSSDYSCGSGISYNTSDPRVLLQTTPKCIIGYVNPI